MSTNSFLKISSITDSDIIKQAAIDCNTVTKDNDTLENHFEWRSFINTVASLFANGDITIDIAKKYIDSSSSVFISYCDFDKNYVEGMKNGIYYIHSSFGGGSRFGRKCTNKLNNCVSEVMEFFGLTFCLKNCNENIILEQASTQQACSW